MDSRPARGVEPPVPAGPGRHPVETGATIVPYGPVSGAAPVVAAKRMVRRALRWYLWPVAERMSVHNRATARALAEHRRQLTWLRLETERLDRDLDWLEEGASGP